MRRLSRVGLVAAAALSAAQCAHVQQEILPRTSAAEARLQQEQLNEATELLEEFVAESKIPGAVAALARDGRVAYLETVGVQDLATRRPMAENTIFRIYSMAKPVTAVAAMILFEEGKFELDDPVLDYLPEFSNVRVANPNGSLRAPARPITVRDLLLHTSGLNHRTSPEYTAARVRSRDQTLPQFIENIVAAPLAEDPGTRYRYSESPTVLGRLIEIWSGQPFDEFLQQRIFGPLGMVDTGFWVEEDDQHRFAEVYGPAPGGGLQPVQIEEVGFDSRPPLLEGAVGLVSTAPDFLRFGQMLLNGGSLGSARILQPATVAMMTENGLSPEMTATRGGRGWGLGNVVVESGSGEYHWNGSAGTDFWVDPRSGTVGVLMTQTSPAFPDNLRQTFKSTVQESILD